MHWVAYWKSVEMLLVIDKLSIEKSRNASTIDKNAYCKVLKMLMTMIHNNRTTNLQFLELHALIEHTASKSSGNQA